MSTLLAQLKKDEGFRAEPYTDTEGHLTIGYGTKIDRLSRKEAELLLVHRLDNHIAELQRKRPWVVDLPTEVQEALYNMAYNLGVPRLLGFTKMWTALRRRDWEQAAAEALDSRWARQVGRRAKRVARTIASMENTGTGLSDGRTA